MKGWAYVFLDVPFGLVQRGVAAHRRQPKKETPER